jgi:hypothetical protein
VERRLRQCKACLERDESGDNPCCRHRAIVTLGGVSIELRLPANPGHRGKRMATTIEVATLHAFGPHLTTVGGAAS